VDRIRLIQDRVQWRTLVNTVMNLCPMEFSCMHTVKVMVAGGGWESAVMYRA